MLFECKDPSKLEEIAVKVLEHLRHNVILLSGEMGSGKTTFVTYLVRAMGSKAKVSSPTYAIANIYPWNEKKIYHLDLYRLKNEEEFLEIGGEEYFYSGNPCFVEWPDRAWSLLPEAKHEIKISVQKESRIITFD